MADDHTSQSPRGTPSPSPQPQPAFRVTSLVLMTFGFKFGTVPAEAHHVVDVRNCPQPHDFIRANPNITGLEKALRDKLLSMPGAQARYQEVRDWAFALIKDDEAPAQLVVAIGCNSGLHRSVSFTELLSAELREHGLEHDVKHRDIDKMHIKLPRHHVKATRGLSADMYPAAPSDAPIRPIGHHEPPHNPLVLPLPLPRPEHAMPQPPYLFPHHAMYPNGMPQMPPQHMLHMPLQHMPLQHMPHGGMPHHAMPQMPLQHTPPQQAPHQAMPTQYMPHYAMPVPQRPMHLHRQRPAEGDEPADRNAWRDSFDSAEQDNPFAPTPPHAHAHGSWQWRPKPPLLQDPYWPHPQRPHRHPHGPPASTFGDLGDARHNGAHEGLLDYGGPWHAQADTAARGFDNASRFAPYRGRPPTRHHSDGSIDGHGGSSNNGGSNPKKYLTPRQRKQAKQKHKPDQ